MQLVEQAQRGQHFELAAVGRLVEQRLPKGDALLEEVEHGLYGAIMRFEGEAVGRVLGDDHAFAQAMPQLHEAPYVAAQGIVLRLVEAAREDGPQGVGLIGAEGDALGLLVQQPQVEREREIVGEQGSELARPHPQHGVVDGTQRLRQQVERVQGAAEGDAGRHQRVGHQVGGEVVDDLVGGGAIDHFLGHL